MKFKELFPKKLIIGAVHFMPLPGFANFQGLSATLEKAKEDTKTLVSGGIHTLIFENNYDFPHTINISPDVEQAMISMINAIEKPAPYGISVLWNDYKAALRIAKETGASFIRVPVFVDNVKTQYGIVNGSAEDVLSYRKSIGATNVLLLTDIHVKHAELLSSMSITESALKAIEEGSDGLIITGKWTGDAPNLTELNRVREVVRDFPIIVGSGGDEDNVQSLLEYVDAVIVSTSLKEGEAIKGEVNIKPFQEKISKAKVTSFMEKVNDFH